MGERSGVEIAEAVSDLRAGRVRSVMKDHDFVYAVLAQAQSPMPIIDATQLYESLVDNPKPVYVYEDHPNIAPPWKSAIIAYVNEHGNVVMMHLLGQELSASQRVKKWNAAEDIDWSRVRWINRIVIWVGGRSSIRGPIPVMGPMFMWRHAVYESGEPADIQWNQICDEYPPETGDMAALVSLGVLNFMNCRNVDIVEPSRPRAESRRIARTGIRVSVINVFPVGRSTRGGAKNKGVGVPLSSVRGHFSHYGPDYGKGLLFGKLAGRFWIPQHARGDKEHGEIEHSYVLKP
jgi:hypothetical protein